MARGVDPGGWGPDPPENIWEGQSMFWPPPLKMSHTSIQNCCITASFTISRMNTWTLSLHWSCLCWRCYHPYVWSAPSRQCPPINAFVAPLGLSYHGSRQHSKTWVQVTRRRQSRSRLICCPSHNWSSTALVAHQGRRSWGGEVLTP